VETGQCQGSIYANETLFAGLIVGGLIRLVISALRTLPIWLKGVGTGNWPSVEAVVTEDAIFVRGTLTNTIEFPYSYRVGLELYTGLHEEPCFLSDPQYMARFPKGRKFVVRVKPGAPECSIMRDKDQTDSVWKFLGK
jgi:hypothetical protein